jgi:DNA polymerase III subunit delta'
MSFSDIRGNEQPLEIIQRYLKNIASESSRSFLFCGPEGVGKQLAAITMAKALNCQEDNADACGSCLSCLKIERRQHPDYHFIDDSDSGSIKIEDIRQLQKDIVFRPYEARKKVFIINNAHSMTPEAANALLKVLEEPPKDSLIILVSAKTALLFKTIISRCQIVKFYPMERQALCQILIREYGMKEDKAHFIAYFSEGRIGQALSLKDSAVFEGKNDIINEFCFHGRPGLSAIKISDKQEFRSALNILAVWFRDLYLLKSGLAYTQLVNLDRKDDLLKVVKSHSFSDFDGAMESISFSLLRLEQNINMKLLLSNLSWAVKS